MKKSFATTALIIVLLLFTTFAHAGLNDTWIITMRPCDSEGNYWCYESQFGTRSAAKDTAYSEDKVATALVKDCAAITCFDLGNGNGMGYSIDCRAPVGSTTKTWRLTIKCGVNWASSSLYLRLWNVSGTTDINGALPISFKVESDPTGTYEPGRTLISNWDATKNGTASDPAYTITFDNASVLTTGSVIVLQLIAGSTQSTAPNPPTVTDEGTYSSGTTSLHASWSTQDTGITEYRYAIGTSPTNLIVSWKSAGTNTNAAETGFNLQPGSIYYWYVNAKNSAGEWSQNGVSDGVRAAKSSTISEARAYQGYPIYIENAIVSSASTDYPGLWLTDKDAITGINVSGITSGRDKSLNVAGVLTWADGVPVLTSAELKGQTPKTSPYPMFFTIPAAANDKAETLSYIGQNTVGLPVVVCGRITQRDLTNQIFYIDDGSGLTDGTRTADTPNKGLRIRYGTGITPPEYNENVRIQGIRSVEKVTLDRDSVVNGTTKTSGTVLYIPVVLVRDGLDIAKQ